MCGIIGYMGKNLPLKEKFVHARDVMMHRGPDGQGLFIDESGGIMLGHRRLAIIDLSSAGAQPMTSSDGRYTIVFNGEIFNYLELRRELKEYTFHSNTDTEVLLAAYIFWGHGCLNKLNGQFAFAIYDKKTQTCFCARDPLGIKPFFYSEQGGNFLFSSEIKGLLAFGIPVRHNEFKVYEYLSYGLFDHSEDTFFDGIKSLGAGHFIEVRRGTKIREEIYWDLAKQKEPTFPKTYEQSKQELLNIVRDAIELQFRSDVPVGLNLSSGLDSNALYHFSKRIESSPTHLYTACLADDNYDECVILSSVLEQEDKKKWHRNIFEPKSFWKYSKELLEVQDQPFSGMPTTSYYALYRDLLENENTTVLLEGQGVDEILAGYRAYLPAFYRDLVNNFKLMDIAKHIRGNMVQNKVFGSAIYSFIRTLFASGDQSRDLSVETNENIFSDKFLYNMKSKYGLPSFPKPFSSQLLNAQYRDISYTRLPRVLRFNDHINMRFSKELRVPYLDTRLVEYCFFLPSNFKITPYMSKAVLQDAFKGLLPPALQRRSKIQFAAFQTSWFGKFFSEDVRTFFEQSTLKTARYYKQDALKDYYEAVLKGQYANSSLLWRVINMELWWRRYIEN